VHLVETPEVTEARRGSLNHSCDSNLWMANEATVVARRDIAAGEELTLDYALHTANPERELDGPCNCGSPLCRGTVRGIDWRLPELRDMYRDHFSTEFSEGRLLGLLRRSVKVFREFARVLMPGGVLTVSTCSQEQLRHGYWHYNLIPEAADALRNRYAP
jgi:hypothetical protein